MLIPLDQIAVPSDRFRYPREGLTDLMESFTQLGQLQPILVREAPGRFGERYTIIAGWRRRSAAEMLQWPSIEALVIDQADPAVLKRMELEENVCRLDMTWQERAKAVLTIHELHKDADPAWGMRQTAALVGFKGHSSVGHLAIVARQLATGDEELAACPTLNDALKLLTERKLREAAERMKGTLNRTKEIHVQPAPTDAADPNAPTTLRICADPQPGTSFSSLRITIAERDCCDFLTDLAKAGQPPRLIYTDPPYAIDMNTLAQPGTGMNVTQVAATHQVDSNFDLLERFVKCAYAAAADPAWLVMWCDQDVWHFLKDAAEGCDWRVQRWPFVWIKHNHHFNQMPASNFTKCTEIAMICAKGVATLVKPGAPNWALMANDKPANVSNPFYKPVALHRQILTALANPGALVTDPFCGSGSIADACIAAGYHYQGCDIDPVHLANLHTRIKL